MIYSLSKCQPVAFHAVNLASLILKLDQKLLLDVVHVKLIRNFKSKPTLMPYKCSEI